MTAKERAQNGLLLAAMIFCFTSAGAGVSHAVHARTVPPAAKLTSAPRSNPSLHETNPSRGDEPAGNDAAVKRYGAPRLPTSEGADKAAEQKGR
ncbi:hypothetical protein [Alicyclobacillus contaminans]|uniref:hypothetical protein n=1 Tax=Alicyclobacillus contaminans TaxID=392016 RepID=UPI00040AEAC8|nr:hypothetical protein [Alicyclobacillus contaminans]